MAIKDRIRSLVAVFSLTTLSLAMAQQPASRVVADWRSSAPVALAASHPPLPFGAVDQGAVPASATVSRMLLLLTGSPAQQQALAVELSAQQDASSSEYHHWLTPSQFADAYQPSASDAAAVAAWLTAGGFTVAPLPAGRGWIEFSGTVGQLEQAFGTTVHQVSAIGGTRLALSGAVKIPAALAPVVVGLVSLDGTLAEPAVSLPAASTTPLAATALAQMLKLDALHQANIDGTGETIAIAARSNLVPADLLAFRQAAGLPAAALSVEPAGDDPGLNEDQAAATVAASWAGVAAPGAKLLVVPAATTSATDGIDLALAAIVDAARAHTVLVTHADCEQNLSAAHQAFYQAVYEQAAAEGLTVVAAAGDGGAAACQAGSTTPVTSGYAVNALAATPWNLAVSAAGLNQNQQPTAWSQAAPASAALASAGGASRSYALPVWQSRLGQSASTRMLPDVSLPAAADAQQGGLVLTLNGTSTAAGGSAAAAAIMAGVNALLAVQHGAVGNAAPQLYSLAAQPSVFTDITEGSAQLTCAAGSTGCASSGEIGYQAAPGFDLATGLGSINAQALVNNWRGLLTGSGISTTVMNTQSQTINPSGYITFVATVTGTSAGDPTGTVIFYDQTLSNQVATAGLTYNGSPTSEYAQVQVVGALAQGGHNIIAQYQGDTNYAPSNSQPITINVDKSATALVVTPSTTSPSSGAQIGVTATITATLYGSVYPSGTVQFTLDGINQGSPVAVTAGSGSNPSTASTTITMPSSGSHTLQGYYNGDTNYNNATATGVTVTIAQSASVTSLVVTPTTVTTGNTIAMTATMAPATSSSGTYSITGSVSFYDGNTLIKTVAVSGNSATYSGYYPTLSGSAHQIKAVYAGDTNWSGSTSNIVNVSSSQGATLTTVSWTPNLVTSGTNVTITAGVQPSASASTNFTMTGTVTFFDGGTQIGQANIANNVASLSGLTFATGTSHVLTATYSGDTNWTGSTSSPVTLTVTKGSTTTTLASSATSVNPNGTLSLTAAVAAATGSTGNTAISGTVSFYDGGTLLGSSSVVSGSASLTGVTLSTIGTHSLTATYSGDTNWLTSTAPAVSVTVSKPTPTVTLTVSPTTTTVNTSVTITAAVAASTANGIAAPTGQVTFLDGTTQLGVATLVNGTATLTGSILSTTGQHSITASYAGDTNWLAATSSASAIVVTKGATASALTISPSTLTLGGSATLTATLAPATSATNTYTITGTVSFYDGSTLLSTATVSNNQATLSSTAIATAGSHSLTAVYSGDTNWLTSTSNALPLTVAKGTTTTTLTATPTTLTTGVTETLTASVSTGTTSTTLATGTVSFYDGTVLLGTSTVTSGTATLTGLSLSTALNHVITAIYSGDANWLGSTSAALTLTSNLLFDTVTLTASPMVPQPGQTVLLTATVTPNTAPAATAQQNPTGTVTFYCTGCSGSTAPLAIGTAPLVASAANSSVAQLNVSLAGGYDTLYAVYAGDTTYRAGTSNSLSLTVQDFSIVPSTANPGTTLNIVKGSSGSATYTIAGLGGYNGSVQVVCATSTQDDLSCTASPQVVTPGGTVTFVIQTYTTGTTPSNSTTSMLRRAGGSSLALAALLLLPFGRRARRMFGSAAVWLLLLTGFTMALGGCTSSNPVVTTGTPLGVASVKITATANVDQTVVAHTQYLSVNVIAK